jgi:hypothetical protein
MLDNKMKSLEQLRIRPKNMYRIKKPVGNKVYEKWEKTK